VTSGGGEVTHVPPELVFNGLNDTSVLALAQPLGGFEVLEGNLHFLLLKRHHGILQKKGSRMNNPLFTFNYSGMNAGGPQVKSWSPES